MKQTNNAIKFLMAQYRAIFKNANIAMVAAMVAAALAAGSANADQSKDGVLDASDFVNVNTGAGVKAETVTKDSALDMSKADTLPITKGLRLCRQMMLTLKLTVQRLLSLALKISTCSKRLSFNQWC